MSRELQAEKNPHSPTVSSPPGLLQRRRANGHKPETVPPIVQEVLRSPGQPLDAEIRAFFEPRFGHDFSQVRVHADAKAAESARAVNALAYTVGGNIVFAEGWNSSVYSRGRRILAHELTHVVQQGFGREKRNKLMFGNASDQLEQEANQVANASLSRSKFSISQNTGGGLIQKLPSADSNPHGEVVTGISSQSPVLWTEEIQNIQVYLRFNGNIVSWPFPLAYRNIKENVTGQIKELVTHEEKIRRQHPIINLITMFPESHKPIIARGLNVLKILEWALRAIRRNDLHAAKYYLQKAARTYNVFIKEKDQYLLHTKVERAENAERFTELTIIALSAIATGGAGTALRASSILGSALRASPVAGEVIAEAGIAGGVEAVRESTQQLGMKGQGLQKEVRGGKIAEEVVSAFVSKLVGGVLSHRFLKKLTPTVLQINRDLGVLLPAKYSNAQKLLTEYFTKFGVTVLTRIIKSIHEKHGLHLSNDILVDAIVEQLFETGFKAHLEGWIRMIAH